MASKAVIVTGSRDWQDDFPILGALCDLEVEWHYEKFDVLFGDAGGADALAHEICHRCDVSHHEPFVAEWNKWGKAAGRIRNREMLDYALAHYEQIVVLAFPLPQSTGTVHMMEISEQAKLDVRNYSTWRKDEPDSDSENAGAAVS